MREAREGRDSPKAVYGRVLPIYVLLLLYSCMLICLQMMADDFRTLVKEQAEESFPINKKKERRGEGDEKGWLALLPPPPCLWRGEEDSE